MSANRPWIHAAATLVAVTAMAVLSSCSSPKPTGPLKEYSFQQESGSAGFGGEVLTDSFATNATVVFVDAKQRTIGLKYPDGTGVAYKAGPEIANFNQFHVGDKVKATVIEERAVSLAGSGALPAAAKGFPVVRRPQPAELGNKPVQTVNLTAKVVAINLVSHAVTLQTADGQTRTVLVRDDIDLGAVNVGDNVSVVVTLAMTVALEKNQ
jgi:hypothetical protein